MLAAHLAGEVVSATSRQGGYRRTARDPPRRGARRDDVTRCGRDPGRWPRGRLCRRVPSPIRARRADHPGRGRADRAVSEAATWNRLQSRSKSCGPGPRGPNRSEHTYSS